MEERLFIVGPNAVGKSNLLDLFHFLADLARPGGGLHTAMKTRGGLDAVHARTARKGGGFGVEVEFRESAKSPAWHYRLEVRRGRSGLALVKKEEVRRGNKVILARPDAEDRTDPERLRETSMENFATNGAFRFVAEFLAALTRVWLFPLKPARRTGQVPERGPLVEDLLARMEGVAPKARVSRLRKISSALQLAVPTLRELRFPDSGRGISLESLFANWRPGCPPTGLDDLSDGTLRLLSMLWGVMENESLLLLEEPELSLHPSVARHFPGLIHRLKHRRRGQVVVTTHSPQILADPGIAPEEILLLDPTEDEGARGRLASEIPEVKALIRQGLGAGEVVLPRIQPWRVGELGFFE